MVRISENELIQLIKNNGRMQFTKIAKKLGVSEAAVRKKIKQMEKNGIIKGYYAKLNLKKIGYNIDSIIGIDTTPESFIDILGKLKRKKEVDQLWTSTGDHMIMFRSWFRDSKELSTFIKKLERIKGITKICPAILVEEIK